MSTDNATTVASASTASASTASASTASPANSAPPSPPQTPTEVPTELAADRPDRLDVMDLHAAIMRELREPRDGFEPVPIWWLCLICGILFWGGWYAATYSGDYRPEVFDEDPIAAYAGRKLPTKPLTPVELGKLVYNGTCIACHQANGQGQPGQYPPLAGSDWVAGSPERLSRIVLHGLKGPVEVRVPGRAKPLKFDNQMPPLGQRLTDEQVAAVLTYVRQEWGNKAEPVTPEAVAATRAATAARAEQWTAAELLALPTAEPPSPAKK